ncbi:hypothetical protein MMC10_006288 [Thelotrema lepadinum]|nr:hypothetical protein [Thelotrema lepadinum]
MAAAFESSYKVVPANPEEIEKYLDAGERAFALDAVSQAGRNMLESDKSRAGMRNARGKRLLANLQGEQIGKQTAAFQPHYANVVYTGGAGEEAKDELVAFCGWHAPLDAVSSGQTLERIFPEDEDDEPDLKRFKEFYASVDQIITKKSEELIGPDRNTYYWYLASLGTVPEHQQRGLGSKLVQWGLDEARKDAAARPGKVKGAWTIATPHGLRTYLKAGMKEMGSVVIDYGKGPGKNGQKYVWLLEKFD